jgi:hypothetical protein
MYKITFKMISPISFIDVPIFDSIISFCEYLEKYKRITDYKKPVCHFEQFSIEHILKKENEFYLCSFAVFDGIDSIEKWRKRWHSRHDYLADFGKAKRRVHTGSGELRSYDMPISIHSAKEIIFYFDGDAKYIENLIKKNLIGIGKKVKYGFGWFSDFEIEKSDKKEMLYYRTLPESYQDKFPKYKKTYGSYQIPYWNIENYKNIISPILK